MTRFTELVGEDAFDDESWKEVGGALAALGCGTTFEVTKQLTSGDSLSFHEFRIVQGWVRYCLRQAWKAGLVTRDGKKDMGFQQYVYRPVPLNAVEHER